MTLKGRATTFLPHVWIILDSLDNVLTTVNILLYEQPFNLTRCSQQPCGSKKGQGKPFCRGGNLVTYGKRTPIV